MIYTRVADSVSDDDSHYAKSAFEYSSVVSDCYPHLPSLLTFFCLEKASFVGINKDKKTKFK